VTKLFLLLTFLSVSACVHAAEYGPFCQWHRDPCTTMAIQWIGTEEKQGTNGQWLVGSAGFGYGDDDDQTVLEDMQGNYRSIYIRRPYEVPADVPEGAEITLAMRYDDGFVIYLDGKEVLRQGVVGAGVAIKSVKSHEADVWEYFKLGPVIAGHKGVVAIEGHNEKLNSSDFTLRPRLDWRANGKLTPLVKEGAKWSYFAGGDPGSNWTKGTEVTKEDVAAPRYQLAYRPEAGGTWGRPTVRARPLGPSDHDVFGVDLRGLIPGTRYEFKIARRGAVIGTWFFETAPENFQEGMTFVTGGDMFHNRELLDAMNTRAGREDPLFALLGGDLAYANGSKGGRWLEWVDSWNKCAVAPDGRLIPMIVVIGNHEVKGTSFKPTDAPGQDQAPFFYSLFKGQAAGGQVALDFGNYLSVIGLDSGHTANIKAQTQWLSDQLATRARVPRQFVCYHRPAWGSGVKEDAIDIRREWSPLFEKHKVDAVFENDHHVYKRTHPIRGGERDDKDGVLYLGDGAWGVKIREVPKDWKSRSYLVEARSVNHLIKVTMTGSGFAYEAMTAAGEVFDGTKRPRRR
jgi:hypothetical protein